MRPGGTPVATALHGISRISSRSADRRNDPVCDACQMPAPLAFSPYDAAVAWLMERTDGTFMRVQVSSLHTNVQLNCAGPLVFDPDVEVVLISAGHVAVFGVGEASLVLTAKDVESAEITHADGSVTTYDISDSVSQPAEGSHEGPSETLLVICSTGQYVSAAPLDWPTVREGARDDGEMRISGG